MNSAGHVTVQIRVRHATPHDVNEIACVWSLSRSNNPFEWACYPSCCTTTGEISTADRKASLSALQAQRAAELRDCLRHPATSRLYVATATRTDREDASSEEIVGFVHWEISWSGVSEAEWQARFETTYNLPPKDDFLVALNPARKEVRG